MRELAAKWRQWSDVVAMFARRQEERFLVSVDDYHALYTDLTRLCREQAGQAESELLGQCREILAPWVTLDALQWTERQIIRDLWDRCREVERMLGGRPVRRFGGARAAWLVGGALAVAAFLAALWIGNRAPVSSPLEAPRQWLRLAERTISSGSLEQTVVLCGALVALVVGVIVWRSARGW